MIHNRVRNKFKLRFNGMKYYTIMEGSGCPSAEYQYMSKKIKGRVMPGTNDSSANIYPEESYLD